MLNRALVVLGKGLVAGAAGTVVMTLVQKIEMKLSGRQASTVPAQAVEKVFHLEPRSDAGEQRLANITHFAYGTAWGAARGALDAAGMGAARASLLHLALVWGAQAVMLPMMGLSKPVYRMSPKALASDLVMHGAYAAATGTAYRLMRRAA